MTQAWGIHKQKKTDLRYSQNPLRRRAYGPTIRLVYTQSQSNIPIIDRTDHQELSIVLTMIAYISYTLYFCVSGQVQSKLK